MTQTAFAPSSAVSLQHVVALQDMQDSMSVMEMTAALSLQNVTKHDWHMQPCCAISGEGLVEGLGWISQRVHRHLKHGPGV
jgi:ADP-ribosylation factor-like protein 5B